MVIDREENTTTTTKHTEQLFIVEMDRKCSK